MMDKPEVKKNIAGDLMEQHFRGMLSAMFYTRRAAPTMDEWLILCGQTEITIRDFGEISSRLGFDFHIEVTQLNPEKSE